VSIRIQGGDVSQPNTAVVHISAPGSLRVRHADAPSGTIPALTYLASLSAGSIPTAEAALHEMALFLSAGQADALHLPWGELRYEHTAAVRAYLVRTVGPSTGRKKLSFLRGVLKEAWRLGLIDGDSYQRAIDLAPVRGQSAREGRALATAELRALLSVCDADPSPAGARDAALLTIGYFGGLRRVEIAGLDLVDVLRLNKVRIRRGKGNKQAYQPMPKSAAPRIQAWLGLRGTEPGPLWIPVRKNGVLVWDRLPGSEQRRGGDTWRRLSLRAIARIVDKRRAQAGLDPFRVHDLRRSYITHILEQTGDLAQAQRLARHSDPKTTALYDRRHEEGDRTAIDLLDAEIAG
jgi:integrase/recombinase XerD